MPIAHLKFEVRSQGLDEAAKLLALSLSRCLLCTTRPLEDIGQAIIIKKNGRVGTRFLGVWVLCLRWLMPVVKYAEYLARCRTGNL